MKRLLDDFGAVASIVVLAILTLVALTLGGVFDGLVPSQAAFLGTLAGALIGFCSLLAGALFNARLGRQTARNDELRRARSCMLMLHARTRAFVTTVGLIARLIEKTGQITVDMFESYEMAARSMRPEEFPDLRLIDEETLVLFYDLNSALDGARFQSIGPVKLCDVSGGVYDVTPEFVEVVHKVFGDDCDEAIILRKRISSVRGVDDSGPTSFSEIKVDTIYKVTPSHSSSTS